MKRAEVAGGGIAGLTVATALAQAGWSVALSEKSAELREDGAALFLWENGLRVLERIGALDAAVTDGTALTFWESVDERNRRLFSGIPSPQARVTCLRRDSLHGALVAAARKAGVEIRTGCEVTGATPDGRVLTTDGELPQANLVVGADGFNSRVRESARTDQGRAGVSQPVAEAAGTSGAR